MAKTKRTERKTKRTVHVRASERGGFALNVKAAELRDLMTEQCRTEDGYVTYYSGTRDEFIKAGIPEQAFPKNEKRAAIRITNHSGHNQDGYIQRKGQIYELALLWDKSGPWYFSAEHPALSEIARMILINVSWWLETGEHKANGFSPTDEVPTQKLRECAPATDYRLPAHKRFKFGPGFRMEMFSSISQLCHAIKCAEIMPIEASVAQCKEPTGGKVVSLDRARIARNGR